MTNTNRHLEQDEETWEDANKVDGGQYDEYEYSDVVEDRRVAAIRGSLLRSAVICFVASAFFIVIMSTSGDSLVKSIQNTASTIFLLCTPLVGLGLYFIYKYLLLEDSSNENDA